MKLPPYEVFPVISHNNVLLRKVETTDLNDLLEFFFYDSVKANTVEEANVMLLKIEKDYLDGNSIHWGITDLPGNCIVGTCGYYRGLKNGEGELGCVLLSRFRKKGFMRIALQSAMEFGIGYIGLDRIFAITTQQNESAIKLLETLKFVRDKEISDNKIRFIYPIDHKNF